MKTLWSSDGTAVKIWGDYSPHPVIALKEVVEHFGSVEDAYHNLQHLRGDGYLPRLGSSENFPFSMKDVSLAYENRDRGTRYRERCWRFGTIYPSAHEFVRGYYRIEGNTAVFSGGTRVTLPR